MRRFAPPLAQTHLGLWRVTQGLLITHLLLGFDAFTGAARHDSAAFNVMKSVLPLPGWGLLHALALVLCFVGLYSDRWRVVRVGYLISFSTFASTTTAFAFAYAQSQISLYGVALAFLATNLSFATLFEPKVVIPAVTPGA